MIYDYLDKFYVGMIEKFAYLNFIDDLIKLTDDINNLFKDADKNIRKSLLDKNIKTRNTKLNFVDVLCYVFNYSFIDSTKQSVVSDLNFDNENNINRTSYYKKEVQIPLSFYNDIYTKLKKILNKYLNKSDDEYTIIAVDGTYSNTNINNDKKLETCLNMGLTF